LICGPESLDSTHTNYTRHNIQCSSENCLTHTTATAIQSHQHTEYTITSPFPPPIPSPLSHVSLSTSSPAETHNSNTPPQSSLPHHHVTILPIIQQREIAQVIIPAQRVSDVYLFRIRDAPGLPLDGEVHLVPTVITPVQLLRRRPAGTAGVHCLGHLSAGNSRPKRNVLRDHVCVAWEV